MSAPLRIVPTVGAFEGVPGTVTEAKKRQGGYDVKAYMDRVPDGWAGPQSGLWWLPGEYYVIDPERDAP